MTLDRRVLRPSAVQLAVTIRTLFRLTLQAWNMF
jgi:hypothetical protein